MREKRSEYISEDLMAIDYFFNNKSQITLEKKEDIKVKLGRSPDDADALGSYLCNAGPAG